MPYWVWLCNNYKNFDNEEIGMGELFVVIIDRLTASGIDTQPVVDGLNQICKQGLCEQLGRFKVLTEIGSTEQDYQELRMFSSNIFKLFNSSVFLTNLSDSSYNYLLIGLGQVLSQLKQEILHSHPSYFTSDSLKQPIHLGCLVYCASILDLINNWLYMLKTTGGTLGETITFPSKQIENLLDWEGDYKEIDFYYSE